MRIGSDTGGTFTDLVADDGRIVKVPSTPGDPGRAVRSGIGELIGDRALAELAHGTTVATNALLERRGARVALVTTAGFEDLIEIARQDRPSLYDQHADRPVPLVARALRFGVDERLAADGSELRPVERSTVPALAETDAEAVAVVLLHADLNGAHERDVAAAIESQGFDVTVSSDLSPEFREYERTVTSVVNAYLRPACRSYLRALSDAADGVFVMTSAGGLVPASDAAERPAALLLSGPAGGVAAGAAAASANGFPDAITFDMGGTSTDVCLVRDGRPEPAAERDVVGFPVRMPSLDVHTIGAGGGSIATLDEGGALTVGPRSAGALPGPACYGHGGTEPTVTDADLVAGRLATAHQLPGIGALDRAAAEGALAAAGVTAEGVIAVVNAAMVQALRKVSVERGVDPRGLALVAFGGAGPLHACDLADELDMRCVIVPARAGVLSAVGILAAPRQVDLVRSWPTPLDQTGIDSARDLLAREAVGQLTKAGGFDADLQGETWLDCRYVGQSHEIRVATVDEFHREHERRNGYARPDQPVEVVALRARASIPAPTWADALEGLRRESAVGPAVIAEPDCTIWIPAGWRADQGEAGALVLTRVEDEA